MALVKRALPRGDILGELFADREVRKLRRAPPEGVLRVAQGAAYDAAERKLAAAFRAAVVALQGQVPQAELERLLATGNVQEAIRLMDSALLSPGAWDKLKVALVQAVQEGADTVAALYPPVPAFGLTGAGSVDVRFNVLNPRTAEYLRRYATDVATELSDGARRAVGEQARVAIREGVVQGKGVKDTARAMRHAIGLNAQQERAAQAYEAALRAKDMKGAGKYAWRDKRFSHEKEPDSEDKIRRMVDAFRVKALAARALTISRTESIRAVNIGQHELWEQQIAEGRVKESDLHRKWLYNDDSKVRPAHKAIPKMNPDGVGFRTPFKSTLGPIMYPGDPAAVPANTILCRCSVFIRVSSSAFAAPDAAPVAPLPPPPPPPKATPPADPLNLAAKLPGENTWHTRSWSKAPPELQAAVAKAPPVVLVGPVPMQGKVGAFYQPFKGRTGRPPYAPPVGQGDYMITQGNEQRDTAVGQATWRHEYGHHLDLHEDALRPRSREATPEAKKDGAALRKLALAEAKPEGDDAYYKIALPLAREREGQPSTAAAVALMDRKLEEAGLETRVRDFLPQKKPADALEAEGQQQLASSRAVRYFAALQAKVPTRMMLEMRDWPSGDIMVQDFLGALTLNKVGMGHKPAYYRDRRGLNQDGVGDGQMQEAFANFVAMKGDPTPRRRDVAKRLAPNVWAAFERILASMA